MFANSVHQTNMLYLNTLKKFQYSSSFFGFSVFYGNKTQGGLKLINYSQFPSIQVYPVLAPTRRPQQWPDVNR